MILKCQLPGAKCPPYSHNGKFLPNDATITGFLPDLRRCANCIAYNSPSLPAFRDDLIQIASITLIQKGPAFNPIHESGASFGTFIRPRICVSLINAKHKELRHHAREYLESDTESDVHQEPKYEDEKDVGLILNAPDVNAEHFVDELIWDISVANFERELPHLLEKLTAREREVFTCIREGMPNCEIAHILELSPPRISQLARSVEQKLREACQKFGLIE